MSTVSCVRIRADDVAHDVLQREVKRSNRSAPLMWIKDAELKVAHQLIEALAGDWDPDKYHDTFRKI